MKTVGIYGLIRFRRPLENTALIPFEISILFDPSDEQSFDLHELFLNNGEAIEV
jgi:hypothetical protein